MVTTQIRLLAKSKATRATLVTTIARWLGFLGVQAKVTQLNAAGDKIKVSITVGQPDSSEDSDWQQILQNLSRNTSETEESLINSASIPANQETKYQRILAYAIQMSNPNDATDWEQIYPHLQLLGLEESMLLGVKSALKVPQSLDRLVKDLDADVAAVALSQTASIALLDRKVNAEEYQVLQTLLEAMVNKFQ
ncbi:hypothetical protein [Hyella patelloides]|nr:hypothetical protein [Hyella patelloides]